MTRPIKFRARMTVTVGDLKKGDWLYWNVFEGFSEPRNFIDVDTLGEFTGLLDKNGKEIYEGDVVSYFGDAPSEIIFVDGAFSFADGPWSLADTLPENTGKVEVIGNIYENPELLEDTTDVR